MTTDPSEELPNIDPANDSATEPTMESSQPTSDGAAPKAPLLYKPDLLDFYPPEAAKILESNVLQNIGLYITFEPEARAKANPCGTQAPEPLAEPLMGIAKITCTKHDDVKFSATAFLITPQVLLTAGHNLLPWQDPKAANRVLVKKVTVSLPKAGGGLTTVVATSFTVSATWRNGNVPDRDYGVIFISPCNAYNIPIPPTIVPPQTLSQNWAATMSGFPDSSNSIYTGTGSFSLDATGNLIAYQINSCEGESGGPVYIYKGNQYVAVAVQAYGHIPGFPNLSFGVLVDQIMCGELKGWIGSQVCI